MGFIELFLTGVGLSMDAFAVAICKGLGMRKIRWRDALVIALFFGGFQALMPLIGWAAGSLFASTITAVDHWIAFGLLAFIGGKMVWEAVHPEEDEDACDTSLSFAAILTQAVATSIDALAVGVSFAVLQVEIFSSCTVIAVTTLLCSLVGSFLGKGFGSLLKSKAEIFGGVILVLIGLKILLEHTLLA